MVVRGGRRDKDLDGNQPECEGRESTASALDVMPDSGNRLREHLSQHAAHRETASRSPAQQSEI